MAYDFHYTPTGTGVISGKEVLEQTEDAINDLGNTAISGVQEALDKAEQALTNSENAVDDAQTALNTANNAEGVAIQAQTDVGNLSGTVTNIGNRVTTAEGNISNLQGRMTTAEGNITNLQGRMTTAESNIGNLQTAVSTAQATANSAQQTATTARQQSYVFRYSSTALTASSTNSNTLLDNTDNLKVGDKVIDSSGVLFSVTAIDTANSTFTIGTALIDLAQDSDVVHTSGNETIAGQKTFANNRVIVGQSTDSISTIQLINSDVVGDSTNGSSGFEVYGSSISNDNKIGGLTVGEYSNNGGSYAIVECNRTVADVKTTNRIINLIRNDGSKELSAGVDNDCQLGHPFFRWSAVYGNTYYYGSNNVEFSTKFVTTDTNQTISGEKTFRSDLTVANTDTTANTPNLNLRNYKLDRGTTDTGIQTITFLDKNAKALTLIESRKISNGNIGTNILTYNTDDSNNTVSGGVSIIKSKTDTNFAPNADNTVTCGRALAKWSDVQTYKVNNLEPSSLSLPSDRSARIDISSYFTNTGTGDTNTYTVPANGYINLQLTDLIAVHCFSSTSNNLTNFCQTFSRASNGIIYVLFPVRKDDVFKTTWYTSTTVNVIGAYFIPCQGNV